MPFRLRQNLNKLPQGAQAAARVGNMQFANDLARRTSRNIRARTSQRTGRLARSVRVRPGRGGQTSVRVSVGVGAPYWRNLEFGTRSIRARRFFSDAIRQVGPNQVRNAAPAMRQAFRQAL